MKISTPITTTNAASVSGTRSEEHTSELQSQSNLVCRLLLEKKKQNHTEEPISRPIRAIHNSQLEQTFKLSFQHPSPITSTSLATPPHDSVERSSLPVLVPSN